MIRQLTGDRISIAADRDHVLITATKSDQFIRLDDDEWRELVYLLDIVGLAARSKPDA